MPRTKKLIKMFNKVKEQILAEPKLYNQNDFGDSPISDFDDDDNEINVTTSCNTPACIAGWITFNVLGKKEYKKQFKEGTLDNATIANEFLAANEAEDMGSLFACAFDWPSKLSDAYNNAKGPKGRARAGVKAIDYFLEGDE